MSQIPCRRWCARLQFGFGATVQRSLQPAFDILMAAPHASQELIQTLAERMDLFALDRSFRGVGKVGFGSHDVPPV
ncbi:MAG TPA: hypothetical protein VKE94_23450 [Gemmataceae bacterium]|nr:hypothetical protein [Gemmataceae bacterium]